MQKIHKTIFINAPQEKVWQTMLDDATYRDWTSAFCPGSHYHGEWVTGSKMLFLGPNPEKPAGTSVSGMVSRIVEARPHEYVSIEHLGIVTDGIEDTTSQAAKKWAPAFENYTFTGKENGTELTIDLDIMESEKEMMETMWDKGLARLKELAENAL